MGVKSSEKTGCSKETESLDKKNITTEIKTQRTV